MNDDVRSEIHDLRIEQVGSHHRLSDWNVTQRDCPDPNKQRLPTVLVFIAFASKKRVTATAT